MKRLISCILTVILLSVSVSAAELEGEGFDVAAPSAVLMEKTTGTVLWEKNAYERLAPASVTKVMTMLLVTEAIEAGVLSRDTVITASEYAASMGGSQIWLEPGERMTVGEMLKCVAVVSANDCAVALAEAVAGSESAFAARMNQRAQELGMVDTHFENCTGLGESEGHYTTAYDIALMSRELIRHEEIKEFTTVWTDSIRDGEFGLSNTNKLIRFYDGATGLKTGFTSQAMFCLSATAERDGVEYIAVVLHAATSAERFESAKALLDYGFANFELCSLRPGEALPPVRVELGQRDSVQPVCDGAEAMLVPKGSALKTEMTTELPESVAAPVKAGERIGTLTVTGEGMETVEIPLVAATAVEKMTASGMFLSLLGVIMGVNR